MFSHCCLPCPRLSCPLSLCLSLSFPSASSAFFFALPLFSCIAWVQADWELEIGVLPVECIPVLPSPSLVFREVPSELCGQECQDPSALRNRRSILPCTTKLRGYCGSCRHGLFLSLFGTHGTGFRFLHHERRASWNSELQGDTTITVAIDRASVRQRRRVSLLLRLWASNSDGKGGERKREGENIDYLTCTCSARSLPFGACSLR